MREIDTNKKHYVTSKQAKDFNKSELARVYGNARHKKVYSSVADYLKELKRVINELKNDVDHIDNCLSPAQIKFYSKCLYELDFTFENNLIKYNPKTGVVINKETTSKSPNRKGVVIEKYIATSQTKTHKIFHHCIKVQYRDFEQGYVIKEVKKKK